MRRYLNQLPQPIVPLDFYERCRDPLRNHQVQAVGDKDAQAQESGVFDSDAAIRTYQQLIKDLPPLNRQLLLYILDLLAVFASKADINRMNAENLAAIFQPGLLSHPLHDMKPQEYLLSQNVLVFLINNQDSFMGMKGAAIDEKTAREIQSDEPPVREAESPLRPKLPQGTLGRSPSNASAGADSVRRFGSIRRNLSVSSKNSRSSMNMPSPISPTAVSPHLGNNSGVGIQRSNTLPSKKSPGIPSSRFTRPADSTNATFSHPINIPYKSRAASPGSKLAQETVEGRASSTCSSMTPTAETYPSLAPVEYPQVKPRTQSQTPLVEKLSLPSAPTGFGSPSPITTPTRERKLSNRFLKSPSSDNERKEGRQPNKLRKKRLPDSSNPSAQSSTQSLQGIHGGQESPGNQPFYTPLPTPGVSSHVRSDPLALITPSFANTIATPVSETANPCDDVFRGLHYTVPQEQQPLHSGSTLKPTRSPSLSVHSRTSITDASEPASEVEQIDDSAITHSPEKKKRFSLLSAHKNDDSHTTLSNSSQLGSNIIGTNVKAEASTTSVGSSSKPFRSITQDSQQQSIESSGCLYNHPSSGNDWTSAREKESGKDKESSHESPEKKGPIGWIKAKVAQVKEERKEREAEKERAKTPPNQGNERPVSQHTASIATQEAPQRDRSVSETANAKT